MRTNRIHLFSAVPFLCFMLAQAALATDVPVHSLTGPPAVDGSDDDWDAVPLTRIPLHKTKPDGMIDVDSLTLKAGTYGGRVYFFIEWADAGEDIVHKPWIWDEAAQRYVRGTQREDRLALQFAMQGDYTTDWRSGKEFTADTWHWKASRSNPLGLAHDKSLVVSRGKLLRAYKLMLPDGGHVYIARPSDAGDKLYRTKRYRRLDKILMPKYLLAESPHGSVADVQARGVWSQGRWRLEMSRKLDTGHDDDAVLPAREGRVAGGVAVFDRSENDDHAVSDTLVFEFLHRPWGAH